MNSSTAVYATFVLQTVAEEDASRVVWPSSPAVGWAAGVSTLWATPDGTPLLTKDPDASQTIEVHGPYQHGGGFPAVNGDPAYNPVDTGPVRYDARAEVGLGEPNRYASEFGVVTWSSYESTAPTLSPARRALHGAQPADSCPLNPPKNPCVGDNVLARRNYPCDNLIGSGAPRENARRRLVDSLATPPPR